MVSVITQSFSMDSNDSVNIILHRNFTVARMVTNVTSEHYGNP